MIAPVDTLPVAPRTPNDIPGWFFWVDRQLFATLLRVQETRPPGDLVELGTYLGKSAVLMGEHLRPGERFVALDLFGRTDLLDGEQAPNRREVEQSYAHLTRKAFERNYLTFRPELPAIVEGPSSVIMEHVENGSVRFVHVDASHLYEHVRLDAENARRMLQPGGLVVFDDYRSEHTPGVSAAVWEAVFTDGLIPIVVTGSKLYGAFADPEPYRAAIADLVAADDRIWSEVQQIATVPVFRLALAKRPATKAERDDARLAETVAGGVERVVEKVLLTDGVGREAALLALVRAELDRTRDDLLVKLPRTLRDASEGASALGRARRWWRRHRRAGNAAGL